MTEILFADSRVESISFLLERRRDDVRVVLVSEDQDAHAMLADALAEAPKAIHILAHGEPGRVLLGAQPIDAASLLDRCWPEAGNTDILIHACRVAEGDAGRRFIDRLAAATGARVGASSQPVGHVALGGTWVLDAATAPVRTPSLFAGHEAWPHLLAVVDGTDGADTLTAGAGGDTLNGGGGNDVLLSGPDADFLNGGDGEDHADYSNATSGIVIDLANPENNTGYAAGDTYSGIDVYVGGPGNDTLRGTEGHDWFWGHDGDDLEYGYGGDDRLEAGNGNDTVHGGDGSDELFGRADNDHLLGEAGNDTMVGGSGTDLLEGDDGNDVMYGDWGADTMIGGDGDDVFHAGENWSATYSEPQSDIIEGGAGNDRYVVVNQLDAATVTFDGGTGRDTLELSSNDEPSLENSNLIKPGSPAIDLSDMTISNVEELALSGARAHSVRMTAAQANGFELVSGAATGDAFRIVGANLAGTVTAGTGATLAAGAVQVENVGGNTVLHIGMDATPGADVTLTLAGTFEADGIQINGETITLGAGTGPGTDPGTGPGTDPGTGPGTDPGTGPGTDPGTGTPPTGNVVTGTAGNDYLVGTAGKDVFVLAPNGGWDVINSFETGSTGDVIDLSAFTTLTSFEEVMAITSENNGDTFIQFSEANDVKLEGITKASLTAANFHLFGSSDPGTDPGTGPGTDPGTGPGTDPGTGPGTDPGTGPGTGPGTDPGTGPGTDPGTGSNPPTTGGGGGSSGGGSSTPPNAADQVFQVSFGNAGEALGSILSGLSLDPADQSGLISAMNSLTGRLPSDGTLNVRVVKPTVPSGSAAGDSIPMTGDGTPEALIIDGRGLPGGASFQLNGVGYAAILGDAQVLGDAADNVLAGDSGNQAMMLGDGNDFAVAGAGADILYGNQGTDEMYGNQGADTLFGGKGDDIILGGRDDDDLNGNMGNDFVNGNLGDDTVRGGQGNDTVRGGQGNDVLFGDLGDDELWGDLGNDTLAGGDGADKYMFASGSGHDTLIDFDPAGGDRIVLTGGLDYSLRTDEAGNAVIVFSNNDDLTLQGVRREQFSVDWILRS